MGYYQVLWKEGHFLKQVVFFHFYEQLLVLLIIG